MAEHLAACALETHRQRSFHTHQLARAKTTKPLPVIDLWPCLTCSWERETSYVSPGRERESAKSRQRRPVYRSPWKAGSTAPASPVSAADSLSSSHVRHVDPSAPFHPWVVSPNEEASARRALAYQGRPVLLQRQHTFLPVSVVRDSRIRVQALHKMPFAAAYNRRPIPEDRHMVLRLNLSNSTRGELALRNASARNRQQLMNSRQMVDLDNCFTTRAAE